LEGEALDARRKELMALLPILKERIALQLPPSKELRASLVEVGCPVHPSHINATLEDLKRAVTGAQMIRNRYTVLDLYYELGLFDRALQSLEALSGRVG
ncbi:MAG: sn-glycerol-1-phosphate dehydrogenase, partial [Sphaerochaeta sp.]|jgi:glycerol-1-phosphate dehydrogenase [NAD(P)+]|nr:sn-glycerol-1-phosphate dehydrogenase [Sphaerochaeta sp.]